MTFQISTSLNKEEINFTSLFEALPGSSMLLLNDPPKFTILGATPQYLKITGITKEDIISKNIFEVLNANPVFYESAGIKNIMESLEHVIQQREAHDVPVQRYDLVNEDGNIKEKYWKIVNKPVFSIDREVAYIIHTAEDITQDVISGLSNEYKLFRQEPVTMQLPGLAEKNEAEEAMGQTDPNIRNLIMQSPVAMCILNGPSFIVEIANDRMYELWGKLPHEIKGKPVFEVLTEAGEKGLEQEMKKVYATGEQFMANELAVPLPRNGKTETLYVNFVYEPFKDRDGNITGIMTVGYDVTEHVVALKKLEESHKEFLFVTDFMPQMIWITKPDGYHYYYNKQWYDYTGLTYGETEGEGWNHVFHPDDQERAWKVWRHSLETGNPYEIEYRCRRYDGEYRWVLGRALPLKDDCGTILKWFGTCTDIHDQKLQTQLLEEKVEERTMELQQVNEQLKQFSYSASHDLQEPLRKISFFLDRLLDNLGNSLTEDNKKIALRIQNTTARMRGLIDDLLAYSNTALGFIHTEVVDLNEVVHDVLDDMEVLITEKKSEINIQELPKVTGDHRQLRQMFQNLISNALKYHSKEQSPKVQISSKVVHAKNIDAFLPDEKRHNTYNLIEVTDNGIGFDPEDAERIFRLFQRLHGKAEYEGSGVGLAIVQKVVENHNGYSWAESEHGKGATFNVLLPV